jgi:hypothetical protein
MTADTPSKQDDRFAEDEVVARLVSDPRTPANCIALYGLVGRSEDPASVRLYGSPQLDSYFEIRKDDVLDRQQVPEGRLFRTSPTTILWVRRDAPLGVRWRDAQEIRAGLLQGALAEHWMTRAEEPTEPARPARPRALDVFLMPTESWICTCNSGCASEVCGPG